MADSKITALTALTAADPVNDMFPIVDVSDTTMAASGTTKRISVNNILSSSPTASGALTVTGLVTAGSATITGALGAANLNVTGAGIPANGMYLGSANNLSFSYASTLGMTLNSTGLGVGVSPTYKLDVLSTSTISGRFKSTGAINALYLEDSGTTVGSLYIGSAGNEFRVVTGSNVALAIDVNRSTTVGPATLTTTATDGFFYIPGCAGIPTGVPTAKAGRIPMAVDTTNNRFYMYVNSAWRFAALV